MYKVFMAGIALSDILLVNGKATNQWQYAEKEGSDLALTIHSADGLHHLTKQQLGKAKFNDATNVFEVVTAEGLRIFVRCIRAECLHSVNIWLAGLTSKCQYNASSITHLEHEELDGLIADLN